MKSENLKWLLTLGIGTLIGSAATYLLAGRNRRRLKEELCKAGHGIKDGVHAMYSKIRSEAEHMGAKCAEKAGEWAEAAGSRASATADNLSQQANDLRQDMDSRAAEDGQKQAQYAENFRKDVGKLRDQVKNADRTAN